ncbi:MAG: hypothetical protein J1E40_06435 [Oscillospiraceae bacterium]|nr:hypothetical protein [Oscillospiraceae bacterium]
MKRIIIGILCMSLMAAFAGCKSDPDNMDGASYGNNDGIYPFSLPPSTGEATAITYAEEETYNAMTIVPAVPEGLPSELDTTLNNGSGDGDPADADNVQISAGQLPELTETIEMHTSYTSENEAPLSFTNPWETTVNSPQEAEEAARSAVSTEFSVRIVAVHKYNITVEILSGEWFDIFGSFVQIDTAQLEAVPDCSPGDYAEIFVSGEIKTSDGEYPTKIDSGIGQINVTESLNIDLSGNSKLAKVLYVYEPDDDHYLMVIRAFDLTGYYFGAEIFVQSKDEFTAGDWIKIDFAEDTVFLETSPMQVDKKYILGIEKV